MGESWLIYIMMYVHTKNDKPINHDRRMNELSFTIQCIQYREHVPYAYYKSGLPHMLSNEYVQTSHTMWLSLTSQQIMLYLI